MKRVFFDHMYQLMQENENIYLIFVDLGYPRYEEFSKKFGKRAINTGASEQTALDIAVGLAYAGKIPVIYTITPFLLRGFETIRTYMNHERLNIKLIGVGVDQDYAHDGYSHDASDIRKIMDTQEYIVQVYPKTEESLRAHMNVMIPNPTPLFINLKR